MARSVTNLIVTLLCALGSGWMLVFIETRALAAQTQAAAEHQFEVASVRSWVGDEHSGAPARFDLRGLRAGRVVITAMSLRDIIRFAYQDVVRDDHHLIGGPDRVMAARFNIEAKFNPELPDARSTSALLSMVRTLLRDRFNFRAHVEPRELPVFALVLASSDKRPGRGLRVSTAKCPPVGPPKAVPAGEPPPCDMIGGSRSGIRANGVTLERLTQWLVAIGGVGRHVVDETGLTGLYDITVSMDRNDPSESIFTALQEQLGLKLTPTTRKSEVLMVDHVELPTPN
jgi:uncharacterized protein (TIGR03435 family)